MKYYLAALLGIFITFGALVPATAEAGSRHDDWYRSGPSYGKACGHRQHWKVQHYKKYSRRVYCPGYYTWRYGHRVWVPGRLVIITS